MKSQQAILILVKSEIFWVCFGLPEERKAITFMFEKVQINNSGDKKHKGLSLEKLHKPSLLPKIVAKGSKN